MVYRFMILAIATAVIASNTGAAYCSTTRPAMSTVTRVIAPQTRVLPLTVNPIVASVQLSLTKSVVPSNVTGTVAQLLITARDPSGNVIVGPGSYVDRNGNPVTITIANSSPSNTSLSATSFSKPIPALGASNVANIIYNGRAHFHFPILTVSNPGLPTTPAVGVILTYAAESGVSLDATGVCVASFSSVGGYFYGGPYFSLQFDRSMALGCPLPSNADIWRMSTPVQTYNVNPLHDSNVQLGFGVDHRVYFAFDHPTLHSGTEFGNLRDLTERTSANISTPSAMTLGNDGSLWFSGLWNAQGVIGKLPPIGAGFWRAWIVTVPHSDSVISIEPGIGSTEALLYHTAGGFFLGTIGTSLSGFQSVQVATNFTSPAFGDLMPGTDGNFYVSATDNGFATGIYKITRSGTFSLFCKNVFGRFRRLSDGTGVGVDVTEHLVHVVPGRGCFAVPKFPNDEFVEPEGIDTTTDDWLLYTNPSGHRLGIF